MNQELLMNALVQVKRMGNLLDEVMDCTQQLAEAIDRNDQVSVNLVIGMRADPINKLQLADQALREQRDSIADPEEREHLVSLLNGGRPQDTFEEMLAERLAANKRILERICALDKVLNQKISGSKKVG